MKELEVLKLVECTKCRKEILDEELTYYKWRNPLVGIVHYWHHCKECMREKDSPWKINREKKMNFFEMMQAEVDGSREKHGDIRSAHEGLGLLVEEFWEVQQEIFKKVHDKQAMLHELVQVAAICYKMSIDCCGLENKNDKK